MATTRKFIEEAKKANRPDLGEFTGLREFANRIAAIALAHPEVPPDKARAAVPCSGGGWVCPHCSADVLSIAGGWEHAGMSLLSAR